MSREFEKKESQPLPQDQLGDFVNEAMRDKETDEQMWDRIDLGADDKVGYSISESEYIHKVGETYHDFMMATGIGLELVKRRDQERNEDEVDSPMEIVFTVTDQQKFIDFLKSFSFVSMDKKKLDGLSDFAAHIIAQLSVVYDLDKPDDCFLSWVTVLKPMAEEYSKLSQSTDAKDLEYTAEHLEDINKALGEKCLKEFWKIDKYELYNDMGRYIPEESYRKPLDTYEKRFTQFLDVLEECVANVNAHKLIKRKIESVREQISVLEGNLDYVTVLENINKGIRKLEEKL